MIRKSYNTSFFIRPVFLYWIMVILFIADVFLSRYIPDNYRQSSKVILACTYSILFVWALFYLFFKSYDRDTLINKIEQLEKEKERELELNDHYKEEKKLLEYKLALIFISDKGFLHRIKTKEELTNISNFGNYIIIFSILFLSQFSFDYIKPIGPGIFIALVVISIIFCIWILIWQFLKKNIFISPITIGHALAIYFLFNWGRHSYVRSYGDEILGSYFEKSEYRTKYYVNLYSDRKSVKKYKLAADIHVSLETDEDENSEGYITTYTTKQIELEKVYLPDGGYLDFDGCQIEIIDKVLCIDQNETEWYIELTKEKVK